jgi:hypothetical protein
LLDVLEVVILRGRAISALVELTNRNGADELILPWDFLDPLDEGRSRLRPEELRDGVGVE